MLLSAANGALAADPEAAYAPDANDTVIYWGLDYSHANSSQYGVGFDAGFVTALNRNIDASGWILTGSGGISRSQTLVANTESFNTSLLIGYLWQGPRSYFSLSGGVNYIYNDETPPGSPTDGGEAGVIAQYGFETKAENALYFQSYGSISSAYSSVYFHAKGGYKTSSLKFGAEFTVYDDKGSSETMRYGVFLGDIPLGRLTMGVSAGYQDERSPGKRDGFYSLVEFSMPISIR